MGGRNSGRYQAMDDAKVLASLSPEGRQQVLRWRREIALEVLAWLADAARLMTVPAARLREPEDKPYRRAEP